MRVALIPGVLALLPEYAGEVDPIADLRRAVVDAVAWLGPDPQVIATEQGTRIAAAVSRLAALAPQPPDALAALAPQPPGSAVVEVRGAPATGSHPVVEVRGAPATSLETTAQAPGVLVVANGSAKRTEKAPGHLDERATAFDAALEEALRTSDVGHLGSLSPQFAADLWVGNPAGFGRLADLLVTAGDAEVDYADDPFGVQYWVMRWTCES